MTDAGDAEGDAAAAVARARGKRMANWAGVLDVLSGRAASPVATYPRMSLTDVAETLARSPSGTMVVSAHFSRYFLLLDLARSLNLPFVVLTTAEGVAFWEQNRADIPSSVRFASELLASDLRACRARRCALFFMADIVDGDLANAYLPFRGKLRRLSISWARLATRFKLDVFTALAHQHDNGLQVWIDHIPAGEPHAYRLASQVIARFDAVMSHHPADWELEDLFRGGRELPADYDDETARREMILLAQSDMEIRAAVVSLLNQERGN